jgi:amino acid permease
VIVSQLVYLWFISLATGLAAIYWIGVDTVRLRRALAGDRRDPAVKDRIFGSCIGLLIGVIGVIGVMHFLITRDMI